jgi:hypothetical protein
VSTITPELRQAIEEAGDAPPRIVDPETNIDYVLIRADVYENIRALVEGDMGLDPKEMTQVMWNTMKEDWEDPKMDDYDNYPESGHEQG